MERCAFFILHHYNEIDHRTPVIYKWSQESDIPAKVVICSNPELLDDYRIRFLQGLSGVQVVHISDLGPEEHGAKEGRVDLTTTLIDTLERVGRAIPDRVPKEALWKYTFADVASQAKSEVLAEHIRTTAEPVVIFDWSRQPVSRALMSDMEVASACFPHGDSPYVNAIFSELNMENLLSSNAEEMFLSTAKGEEGRAFRRYLHRRVHHDEEDLDWLQNVVVPNDLTGERWQAALPPDRLHVLGSPRFNREWLTKLDEIRPPTPSFPEGEWNLVLFSRDPGFFVSKDRLRHTIELLARFSGVELIVKEHTSGEQFQAADADPDRLSNVTFVGREVHSPSLLDWGDMFLHAGTSVVFEAVMKDKPIISLDYVHANRSSTGLYLPDTVAHTFDDLFMILTEWLHGGRTRTYSQRERSRFIEEMIESTDQAVLDAYVDLIDQLFHESARARSTSPSSGDPR